MTSESWRNDPRPQLMEEARQTQAGMDAEAEAAVGLTFNQSQVLALIAQFDDGAMVSKLCPALGRAVHTLTMSVSQLERKGLVQRFLVKGEDGRIVRIKLTPEGNDALGKPRTTSLPLP